MYKHQRRGVSRNKRIVNNDDSNEGTVDTTIAFVCINRLAEEFNTEESIRQFYRLDSEGRLPTEIVTIDDDDDEDDEEQNVDRKYSNTSPSSTRSVTNFTEKDLHYFCSLRVKPKTMTKVEAEMFDKKVSEIENHGNDKTSEIDPATLFSNANNRKNRSLNSVVAMLTNKSQNRGQLLEQYKQSKSAKSNVTNIEDKQGGKNTESVTKQPVIDLIDDVVETSSNQPRLNDPLSMLNTSDGNINIPGKGQYRIVEQIVTKQGDKNKIILRLGKPSGNHQGQSGKGGIQQQQQQPTQSSKVSSSTYSPYMTTSVNDMFTLSNMARSHAGLDEVLRNRLNKVRSICKTLPKNPLLWNPKHVATFITNADFEKYAKSFYDQVSVFS